MGRITYHIYKTDENGEIDEIFNDPNGEAPLDVIRICYVDANKEKHFLNLIDFSDYDDDLRKYPDKQSTDYLNNRHTIWKNTYVAANTAIDFSFKTVEEQLNVSPQTILLEPGNYLMHIVAPGGYGGNYSKDAKPGNGSWVEAVFS